MGPRISLIGLTILSLMSFVPSLYALGMGVMIFDSGFTLSECVMYGGLLLWSTMCLAGPVLAWVGLARLRWFALLWCLPALLGDLWLAALVFSPVH